jgi:putative ABC transport system permease protein
LTRYLGGPAQLAVHHQQLKKFAMESGSSSASSGTVFIDHVRNLESTLESVRKESVSPISAASTVKTLYDAIDRSMHSALLAAAIIFFVSAAGISNTMVISVIERSEEIGILKAVGASNQYVTRLILLEGIITGAIGGLLSIAVTYLVTYMGDGILRITTFLVGTLVATLAGVWPARKAARLDPIQAFARL